MNYLTSNSSKKTLKPGDKENLAPGLLRRLCVIVYDSFLLLAVLFLATAIALPVNAGQAFSTDQYGFTLYLITVSFVFYGWFWTHGGQTLGLRAWKLKLIAFDGGTVTWRLACIRFFAAIASWSCFGLGFIWCIFDKNSLCWHDYLSKTRLSFADQKTTNP